MEHVKTEEYLNEILEKNYDAARGYLDAATNVKNVHLKRWLTERGAMRSRYCARLGQEMKGMNMEPVNDGTVLGDIHRGWMNIKTALSFNKDEAVFEECMRGEKNLLDEYTEALEHRRELPPTIHAVLKEEADEVAATVAKLNRLEDIADD